MKSFELEFAWGCTKVLFAISVLLYSIEFRALGWNRLRGQALGILPSYFSDRAAQFIFVVWIAMQMVAFLPEQSVLKELFLPQVCLILTCSGLAWISFRCGGAFNGGSDTMTFQTAIALTLGEAFPAWKMVALVYVGCMSIVSYFVAGSVKVIDPNWRSGRALQIVFETSSFPVPPWFQKLVTKSSAAKALALGCIAFELGFPLLLLSPSLTPAFLLSGLLFHLLNWYTLGLNRFFWSWTTTYPAIWFVSGLNWSR